MIQRQRGHARLGATSIYRQVIDPRTSRGPCARPAPMMSATAGLRL
jgi:hypothetical protein